VAGFAALASDVSLERRERGRQRRILERYMSQDIVREMLDNPGSYLDSLGGERKVVVTLFSDLKGFTADSERLDPVTMVSLLNEYFGEMVAVIFAHRGIHDKFMGDAIMATWGGLRTDGPEKDACNAVQAAFEMRRQLHKLNAGRADVSAGWDSGVGISQGSVLFGNIGSNDKMDITVIGDAVNLASRIEGLTRIYGCPILVDEDVAKNVREICEILLVDEVRVKGRTKPEKLYYPYQEEDLAWKEAFTTARGLYLEGKFAQAGAAFGSLTDHGLAPKLAEAYRRRCELLLQDPPEDWTGIWTFQEK
jgi:adenylate cyclase